MGRIDKVKQIAPYVEAIPAVPKGFIKWAESERLWGKPVIYYKRNKAFAECFCTSCGKDYKIRIRRSDSYEQSLLSVYDTPAKGDSCKCINCGAKSIYQPKGHCKQVNEGRNVYVIQKLHDNKGIVIRWFNCRITYSPTVARDFIQIEAARQYFATDTRAVLREYQLYDHYRGEDFWTPYNIGGLNNISFPCAEVWEGSYKELAGTEFEYCCLKEYLSCCTYVTKVNDYMQLYRNYPVIEFFIKNGMKQCIWNLDDRIMKHEHNLLKAFKMSKRAFRRWMYQVEYCASYSYALNLIDWFQYETETGIELSEALIKRLMTISRETLQPILKYMSLQQALNYLEREGVYIMSTMNTWLDYMKMAEKLGMNLNDPIVYHTKNLHMRHDALVMEINKRDAEKEALEYIKKFPKAENNLKRVAKKYAYEDEEYIIRAAADIAEILQESRELHHCVATSDRYFDRINRNESYILFLRKKKHPDVPYYTLEVEPNGNIRQRRTYYNRQTDLEQLVPVLKEFQKAVRARMDKDDIEDQKRADELRELDMEELRKKSPEFARTLEDDYMAADAEELAIPQELLEELQEAV